MWLDQNRIHELHAAVISVGLDRRALLSGIHAAFVASLPISSSPSAQILSDLAQLNSVEQLSDGSVPLLEWLRTAAHLAGPRKEGRVFEEASSLVALAARAKNVEPPRPTVAASTQGKGAVKVFLSAAAEDERFVDAFARHLAVLSRQGAIELWRRSSMPAGVDRRVWIEEHLGAADLVVLMLSPDYLASDDTYSELERALALRDEKGTRVVPVIARTVGLESTPLAGLTRLPRSGVAIGSSRDADATYTEIVGDLRAIIADLRERPRTAAGMGTRPLVPVVDDPRMVAPTPPDVRVGLAIDDVFVRNGVPGDTYVEPEQAPEIQRYLGVNGRGLVVEGPTQIGKTTAVTKLLGDAQCARLDAYGEADEAELLAVVAAGVLEGHLLIENVHHLSDATLARVARCMRQLADRRPATSKVTLIGISNVASRLARLQPDLGGRFDRVEMNRQPPAKVHELVTQGERVANLRFVHAAEIVAAACGSFRLAQELCYQCAVAEGVDRVIAGAPRSVSTLPDDSRVRAAARSALDVVFEDPVGRFAEADREIDAPGACIALLWKLSVERSGRVLIRTVAERYSQLDAAFRWVQDGHLAAWLRAPENVDVAALLTIVAGELRAPDPRFLYYLGVVDWKRLGAMVGVEVLVPSESLGDLQIVHPSQVNQGAHTVANGPPSAASIARRSLLDAPPPFPWWHPSASRLLSLLLSAYPEVDAALFVCAQVQGLRTGHVLTKTGAEPLWRGVLESAANQGKLRALVDVVLRDGNVAAYHDPIRDAAAPPGAPSPVA